MAKFSNALIFPLVVAAAVLVLVPQAAIADCTFLIRDLQLQSPVPVRQGKFLTPTRDGKIEVKTGRSVDLYCSTQFENYLADKITVTCAPGTENLVRYAGVDMPLNGVQLQCKSNNIHSDVETTDAPIYHIGYSIDGTFSTLIDVDFETAVKRPIYAHHQIAPILVTSQQVVTKAFSNKFRADKLFGALDDDRYTYESQRRTICEQTLSLSKNQCDAYFEPSRRFLARGHLAPAADFVYLTAKRATYSLINVAPQWQQLNNGAWKKMEAGVRAKSLRTSAVLDMYTGTLGTLRLRDGRGTLRELYLDGADGKMPVPAIFYKVVIDQTAAKGVVFLAINHPLATAAEVQTLKDSVKCADVADQLSWPTVWFSGKDRVDRSTAAFRESGYMFACVVKDFARHVDSLPLKLQTGKFELLD